MTKNPLKLSINLVPETCAYKNLRQEMTTYRWKKLRNEIYSSQGNACYICGAKGKFHLHEDWEYNENDGVQKLIGLHAICLLCHNVIHFGMAQNLAEQGYLEIESVINHFLKVNEVNIEIFVSHKKEAEQIYKRRSERQYQIDFGEWSNLPFERSEGPPENDIGPEIGGNIPNICPYCHKEGTLEFVDDQYSEEMSDGEEAEYYAGNYGAAACNHCNNIVFLE